MASTYITPNHRKYVTPRQRSAILLLLAREGAATQKRLSEVLGSSRMTATRMADQLLSEGLLQAKHASDPVTGRKSLVYIPAEEAPLLLLCADCNELTMSALYCDGTRWQGIRVPYRFSLDVAENQAALYRAAKQMWPQIEEPSVRVIHCGHTDNTSLPAGHTMLEVSKTFAAACGLYYFPELADLRTVLHIQADTTVSVTLFVRETTDDPWFAVREGPAICDMAVDPTQTPEQICSGLRASLKNLCAFITPDVVILELPQAYDGKPVSHTTLHKLLPINLPSDNPNAHPMICLLRNGSPLWAIGLWDMLREERWTE